MAGRTFELVPAMRIFLLLRGYVTGEVDASLNRRGACNDGEGLDHHPKAEAV
jgi:hypothetical protein